MVPAAPRDSLPTSTGRTGLYLRFALEFSTQTLALLQVFEWKTQARNEGKDRFGRLRWEGCPSGQLAPSTTLDVLN